MANEARIHKAPSYGEVIAGQLREAIVNGRLQPGQELRQTQLAESLGVSRIPVRDALLALERDGLVTISSSRRVVVASLDDQDILDHYSIRALLEGEAAGRAARSAHDLATLVETHDATTLHLDGKEFAEANELFHNAVWNASGSPKLVSIISKLWTGLTPHTPYLLPAQVKRSVTEHQQILEAILSGDSEQARAAMYTHITRSSQDLITFRQTIAQRGEAGGPDRADRPDASRASSTLIDSQ